MKICIIGNSHVGALKNAWRTSFHQIKEKEIAITFFAARGSSLKDLEYKDGILSAKTDKLKEMLSFTSGGESFIDLNAYDVLLLYGLNTKPYFPREIFYSKAVTDDFLEDCYSDSLALKILKMIPSGLVRKIYIGHNPLRAENSRANRQPVKCANDDYDRGISLVNDRIFHPHGATLLKQPLQTIAENGKNTMSIYSIGSRRLEIGAINDAEIHPTTDRGHMNESYGEAWLNHFLLHVGKNR